MLAERVVGKENVFVRHMADHVVGRVHHGRGNEGEFVFADGQFVPRLYADDGKIAVIAAEVFFSRGGNRVDFRAGRMAQDKGQRAAVVGFGVVGYDHVDLVGLYDGADRCV